MEGGKEGWEVETITGEDGNFLYYVERHLGEKRAGAWGLWFRHMAHFQVEQEMNKGFGYTPEAR